MESEDAQSAKRIIKTLDMDGITVRTAGQGWRIRMSDLISRQAAIDIANDIRDCISVDG